MNASQIPPQLAPLHQQFLELRRLYSSRAWWWKRVHQLTRMGNMAIAWSALLLGVAGLSVLSEGGFPDLMLRRILPILSGVGFLMTVVQLVLGPERRWLNFRQAEQRLGNLSMLVRAGVPPFHDADDTELLTLQLDAIRASANPPPADKSLKEQIADILFLPAPSKESLEDLTRQGIWPPLDSEEAYLKHRLLQQKQWYVRKAHVNRFTFFLILTLVGCVYLFNIFWTFNFGKTLWLPTLTTGLNVLLFLILENFDSSTLWRRYQQTATQLDEVERAFHQRAKPFDMENADRRLTRLVEQVEQILETEFHYWYAAKQQSKPAPASTVIHPEYKPSPIDTAHVAMPEQLAELQETLSRNIHDRWAQKRLEEGWQFGQKRDESRKEHPCLVAYEKLPESEKDYDRVTAMETLKTILALGYHIEKK